MDGAQKKILEKFITSAADSVISIVLVGSQATGNDHDDSDIDLIVLTKHKKDVDVIHNIGIDLNRSESRPVIDCKVYSESEFSSARTGLENRFLWTCITNGKVLYGEDIIDTIQLVPQLVSESYWMQVQSVENACINLDSGVQYTGSCFYLYDALSSTYFVDRYIFRLTSNGKNKEEFIKSKLRSEFSKARERYYWVVDCIDTVNSQNKLRIPVSVDRKFKQNDYKQMYARSIDILELVQNRYKEINNWSE
jgi:predicted nucleotidyltransferase